MTQDTINAIGNTANAIVKISLLGFSLYAAWHGRWFVSVLAFLLGATISIWKSDGKWFDTEKAQ